MKILLFGATGMVSISRRSTVSANVKICVVLSAEEANK